MLPTRLITHKASILRPVTGTNAAGDDGVPTGAYAGTEQDNLACIAEKVDGSADSARARTPDRATWTVLLNPDVVVLARDRVELVAASGHEYAMTVDEVRRFDVPRAVAHQRLTCREITG